MKKSKFNVSIASKLPRGVQPADVLDALVAYFGKTTSIEVEAL